VRKLQETLADSLDPKVCEVFATSKQFAKIGYTASFKPVSLLYSPILSRVVAEHGVSLVD